MRVWAPTIRARSSPTCQRSDGGASDLAVADGGTQVADVRQSRAHAHRPNFRRRARVEFRLLLVNWTSGFLEDLNQPVGRPAPAAAAVTGSVEPSTPASSTRRLRLRLPRCGRVQPLRVNPEGVVATETVGVAQLHRNTLKAQLQPASPPL